MIWMQSRRQHCPDESLVALLHDTLEDTQTTEIELHLRECTTCQRRLTDLAAGPEWWLDASRMLEPMTGESDGLSEQWASQDDNDGDQLGRLESDLLSSGLIEPLDSNLPGLGKLGRYHVQRVLGAGGTGIVLLANDTQLSRTVAIKVLTPALASNGPARRRFAREAQAVAAVVHENVVTVHHVESEGKIPFLVMQYIDGESLQDLVMHRGPLDVTTSLRITAQIAAALAAAHDQGLVHRDVKPANILMGATGQRAWITDFGLARAVDDASLTRTGFIAGTPHYMSPEQARGETVGPGSDLFGLGSVLYFMLTGRPPFRAERTLAILNRICTQPHRPVREVNPDVPPSVAQLVDRMLQKDAPQRFDDAEDLRRQCLRILATGSGWEDPLENDFATSKKQGRRIGMRRFLLSAGGIAVVGALLFALSLQFNQVRNEATDSSQSVAESGTVAAERLVPQEGPAVTTFPSVEAIPASTWNRQPEQKAEEVAEGEGEYGDEAAPQNDAFPSADGASVQTFAFEQSIHGPFESTGNWTSGDVTQASGGANFSPGIASGTAATMNSNSRQPAGEPIPSNERSPVPFDDQEQWWVDVDAIDSQLNELEEASATGSWGMQALQNPVLEFDASAREIQHVIDQFAPGQSLPLPIDSESPETDVQRY